MEGSGEALQLRMRKDREKQLEAYRQKYGFDFRFGYPDPTVGAPYEYTVVSARVCPLMYVQQRGAQPQSERPRTC